MIRPGLVCPGSSAADQRRGCVESHRIVTTRRTQAGRPRCLYDCGEGGSQHDG